MTGPSAANAVHGHRAGFASRVAAATIDVGVVLLLDAASLVVASVVRHLLVGPPFGPPDLSRSAATWFGTAVAIAYLAGGWALAGRTVGMQVLGLRLVDGSGRTLRPGRALVRAVLCVAFPVGLLWVLVSGRNASVQDLIVRSGVVYDWSYGSPTHRVPDAAGANRSDVGGVIRR